jgi:hypothetical protein
LESLGPPVKLTGRAEASALQAVLPPPPLTDASVEEAMLKSPPKTEAYCADQA